MTSRFGPIVNRLRSERILLLSAGKKKRAKGLSKPRKSKKIIFDNPELERIFNSFPKDMQEMLRKA